MDKPDDAKMWSWTGQGSAVSYTVDVENMVVVATTHQGQVITMPLKDMLDVARIFRLRSEEITAWAAKKVAMDELGMQETEKPRPYFQ